MKLKRIINIARHRNGVSAAPFEVVLFTDTGDGRRCGQNRRLHMASGRSRSPASRRRMPSMAASKSTALDSPLS